ncbi:MAG: (d)CMP kinase [Atopobiaceae bacterium]|nr:(d)CMP kinase [Atopobiaceae bacterium]
MIVAIDGPAGSGKSTVAKAVADKEGLTYLDTGAMYRAVTWKAVSSGIDYMDEEAVTQLARESEISFEPVEGGQPRVLIDGKDVTRQIRTPMVDSKVSRVSSYPELREIMVARQRELSADHDVVAEGRDIGTAVFPNADVKVFLTADVAARARRRAIQQAGGNAATGHEVKADPATEREVLQSLKRRDELDSSREASPLKPAEDAVHIDSSNLTVEQEVEQISELIAEARVRIAEREEREAQERAEREEKERLEAEQAEALEAQKRAEADEAAAREEAVEAQAKEQDAKFERYYENSMREHPWPSRLLYGFIICVVGFFSKLFWRWRLEDGNKFWTHEGRGGRGGVIVMNHVSMLDPVVVAVSGWYHHKRVRPMYKKEFDKSPIVSWFFAHVGAIPVVRGSADLKAVRRAQRAVERGEYVLVFPEGTRIRSDEQPVEIHGGFALIAQLAKADVLPMAIVGARQITPEGSHFKRFITVYSKAGDPITSESLREKKRKARIKEIEEVSMKRVYELRDELRQEHPGKE